MIRLNLYSSFPVDAGLAGGSTCLCRWKAAATRYGALEQSATSGLVRSGCQRRSHQHVVGRRLQLAALVSYPSRVGEIHCRPTCDSGLEQSPAPGSVHERCTWGGAQHVVGVHAKAGSPGSQSGQHLRKLNQDNQSPQYGAIEIISIFLWRTRKAESSAHGGSSPKAGSHGSRYTRRQAKPVPANL